MSSTWLIETAWPLWLEHGVDWNLGGFHESLHPEGLVCPADFRRLRVAARQTYVFARAAEAGVPRAAEAVTLGLGFLRDRALQADGGYAWRFALDHTPIDQTRDLYDHAFVLLAFAHTGADLEARAVLDYLDRHFRHPAGGFRESLPDQLPRRQNPHMHLLEALLAAAAAFGDPVYLDRADELVDLFLDRLFQHADSALPEYFDAHLAPIRDPARRYPVEPGHHFEWVWLLDRYLRSGHHAARRDEVETAIRRLMDHAERWGVDPASGLVLDVITQDGALDTHSFRLWPQTERLKAASCRPDLARTDAGRCLTLLQRYLREAHPGLWCERILPDGPMHGHAAPASSLYHLTCALLEVEEGPPPQAGEGGNHTRPARRA